MLTLQLEESRMKMMLSQIKPHFSVQYTAGDPGTSYTMPEGCLTNCYICRLFTD